MWIRKSRTELAIEVQSRYRKARFFYYPIQLVLLYFIANELTQLGGLKDSPELGFLFVIPIFAYFAYRNYVRTGSLSSSQAMCLFCEDGLGYKSDGWGFKSYGIKKPKWYQTKACSQSDKCEFAFMYQVKLVDKDDNEIS